MRAAGKKISAAREARILADKAKAEERRHHENIEQEARIRREKDDATQEMMMLIGAIYKKE